MKKIISTGSVGLLFGLLMSCNQTDELALKLGPIQSKFHLDKNLITVSGISSGGYMAHQYHIAYSDQVNGAALFASGPYNCAQGELETALASCVESAQDLDLSLLINNVRVAEQKQAIASLGNLKDDKVMIYHGSKDVRVDRNVTRALADFYAALDVKIKTVFDVASGHGFPTMDFGVECENTETPHINNCQYDGAGEALSYFYPGLKRKSSLKGRVYSFSQSEFVEPGGDNTLAETGYIYAPEDCQKGASCKIHIAFHGCQQNAENVGLDFVENTGYNTWAEANNILVIYPQTKSTYMPLNPKACWDWWGYTGDDYLARNGAQLKHINNIVMGL